MTPQEQAEELLPCFCYRHVEPLRNHHETCPAYYREAVAAALQAKDDEINALKERIKTILEQSSFDLD
jgi:hypothetical protein